MKKTLLLTLIVTVGLTACGKSDAEKQADAQAFAIKKAEDTRKGFHCLSGWNGSHYAIEQYVKKNLRDPDSYQHNETLITPVKDGIHTLIMTYRAKNGFGGYVPGMVIATVNNETCKATIK